jgi:hypothetical protein
MARAEDLSLHHHPFRRFVAPSTSRTFLTTILTTLLRRARTPTRERMSHEWLVSHERESSRHD